MTEPLAAGLLDPARHRPTSGRPELVAPWVRRTPLRRWLRGRFGDDSRPPGCVHGSSPGRAGPVGRHAGTAAGRTRSPTRPCSASATGSSTCRRRRSAPSRRCSAPTERSTPLSSTTGWTTRHVRWYCAASPPRGCSSVPASYRCGTRRPRRRIGVRHRVAGGGVDPDRGARRVGGRSRARQRPRGARAGRFQGPSQASPRESAVRTQRPRRTPAGVRCSCVRRRVPASGRRRCGGVRSARCPT